MVHVNIRIIYQSDSDKIWAYFYYHSGHWLEIQGPNLNTTTDLNVKIVFNNCLPLNTHYVNVHNRARLKLRFRRAAFEFEFFHYEGALFYMWEAACPTTPTSASGIQVWHYCMVHWYAPHCSCICTSRSATRFSPLPRRQRNRSGKYWGHSQTWIAFVLRIVALTWFITFVLLWETDRQRT